MVFYRDPFPGIPVTAAYSYSTDSTFAILLTSPPFLPWDDFQELGKEKCYRDFSMLAWGEETWLVDRHSTYATCFFVILDFAKAIGIGEAGPSGEWHREQADDSWGIIELSELLSWYSSTLVFFAGLRFQYTWVLGKVSITLMTRSKAKLKPSRLYSLPIFRGSNNSDSKNELEFITSIPTLESDNDAHYVVTCKSYIEEEAQNSEEWWSFEIMDIQLVEE